MVYADDFDERPKCFPKLCTYEIKVINGNWQLSGVEDRNRVESECKGCHRKRTDFWSKSRVVAVGEVFSD